MGALVIPHSCIVKHDPPNSYGDCLRACVASLLSIDRVEDVPHFLDNGDDESGRIRFVEYLASRGYRPFYQGMHAPNTIDDIFKMMREVNTDIPYLLFCTCGGGDHVLICKNDKVIHDPAWYRSPIDGPGSNGFWVIVVMVPLNL